MTAAVFLINERRRRDVRDEINVRNQLAGAAAEGDHDDDVDDEMSWAVSLSFSLFPFPFFHQRQSFRAWRFLRHGRRQMADFSNFSLIYGRSSCGAKQRQNEELLHMTSAMKGEGVKIPRVCEQ